MSEVIRSMGEFEFSALLRSVLVERQAEAPAGMEQRLQARLAQETVEPYAMAAGFFGFAERVRPRRSSRPMGFAIAAHALILVAIFAVASAHRQVLLPKRVGLVEVTSPPVILPAAQSARQFGGGGGHHDNSPAAQGRLPRFAK